MKCIFRTAIISLKNAFYFVALIVNGGLYVLTEKDIFKTKAIKTIRHFEVHAMKCGVRAVDAMAIEDELMEMWHLN